MTLSLDDQIKKYRHPAFGGLSEKDFLSIYKAANLRKIKPGASLFKAGDRKPVIYVILKGSVQVLINWGGTTIKIPMINQGQWISPAAYSGKSVKTVSAVATDSLTVLVLEESILNDMSFKIQSVIYRNLAHQSAKRISDLSIKQAELSMKHAKQYSHNRHLASKMADSIKSRSTEYTNSEIIQNILNKIPRLPMYTHKLAIMLSNENVSSREVATMAGSDPSLVGAVLKTVNSAYYGLKGKVADFPHALMLLGFNQVYQIAVDTGIRTTMPKAPEFQELQLHSILVSFISFELSRMCNMSKPVSDSTIGLLHDIGRSVILLLKKQNPKMIFLIDLLDHTILGSLLLEKWNIPDFVFRTIEYQGYPNIFHPEQIPSEYRNNVAVLYIAHLCSEFFEGRREYELSSPFLNEYMNLLGVSDRTIGKLVRNQILPGLSKQMNNFPKAVRRFLSESMNNLSGRNHLLDAFDG